MNFRKTATLALADIMAAIDLLFGKSKPILVKPAQTTDMPVEPLISALPTSEPAHVDFMDEDNQCSRDCGSNGQLNICSGVVSTSGLGIPSLGQFDPICY